MRVVSGTYRGRKLFSPEGNHTRPTLDRVKENLYNLLPGVSGMKVLDLFSGSGSLGIEAVSRGAEKVWFCDNDAEAVQYLKRNLERMDGEYHILETDFLSALRSLAGQGVKLDLILLDPPYAEGLYEKCLAAIRKLGLLAEDGIISVECADAGFGKEGFEVLKQRRYGIASVVLLKQIREKPYER